MIRLHHADRLEPLLDALADVLRAPVDDPFAPELIVVPSMGMADTVLAGLGRRLGESSPGRGDGVAANLEFAYPGRFVGRALGDESTGDVAGDPWSIDRLTWSVLDVLADDQRRDVPTLGVPVDLDQGGLWVLARHVADLFDRYITQRPQMITLWADGVDSDAVPHEDRSLLPLSDEHRWQAAVWRAVRARIGVSSPAEMMPYLLTAIRAGEVRPSLPPRVALFGFGSLAPGILAVLRALDGHRELHAFVRHPSSTAWTGLDSRLAGALQIRGARDLVSHTQHPLISSWGRPSLEARALLNGIPEIDDRAVVTTPAPRANTLLTAVQDGIRADRAPTAIVGLDGTDGSLQVHACHGELRQLEVLRDALGHRFASDPTLQPHEVHVLCPDLERFAPLVQAVFDRGALPIPVRVGDRSLTVDDPFAGALQALLGLVAGRASLSDVLAVMQYEPVRRRFHWSLDHVERIAAWAVETGTRWGLEPHHRTEWGVPGTIDAGTWRLAVDRLLLGVAMPAPSPRQALGDLSPFDDLGGDDIGLVGTLADFLERLLLLHDRAEQARPIADWVDVLHATADDFLAADRREPWRLTALHRSLDAIVESASAAASGTVCAVPLSFGDLRAVVERTSSDRPGRLSLRTGAVTVTSLVPLHGVPARVVCLLGLDDGSLRSGSFDGDDILGGHPCVGERHPRHESRQMLLDAVLAPSDALIITCNGADLTTNKPTPFVVPLVELLDATSPLVGSAGADGHDRLPFVVRHPRHGFDERALVPGGLTPLAPGPFTFDTAMLDGAVARRDAVARQPAPAGRLLRR
ncbi:MAG: exodeoxyribonuclease V subunit gamma, partial [Ilumatobacteraceae bacterium]